MTATPDLAWSTATQLSEALQRRDISSLDLTRLHLDRLEQIAPTLHALATLMPARALAEAEHSDRRRAAGAARGPLDGIPYGAKDLLAARGAPTTWGAPPFKDQQFDHDAA